jgi:membrane-associated phospholipid phosphatase
MLDLTKPWPLGLDRGRWLLFYAGVLVILALLSQVDVIASRAAIGWPDQWRAPFFFITDYGLSDWILIPTLIGTVLGLLTLLVVRGRWRKVAGEFTMLSAYVFVGVGLPGLLSNLLKRLVGRGRPTEFDSVGAFSFQNIVNDWTFQSFPSGHTTTAIALAFTLGFLWPRLFPVLMVLGIVVGISRVPVGMHYPTDVFGGLVVGMLGAYLVRNVCAMRGWLFERRADGRMVPKGFPALRQLFQPAR